MVTVTLFCCAPGGSEIQTECSEYVKRNGSLLPAQLYVSRPGRLPCKAVIHAVGPIWSSGHKNEKNLLYDTVFNVLEEAEHRGFTSVALPAISTGLYRFPLQPATMIVMDAVKNFLKQAKKLCEVHIIDTSMDVISQFCTTAETAFRDVDNATVVHFPHDGGARSKIVDKPSEGAAMSSKLCVNL